MTKIAFCAIGNMPGDWHSYLRYLEEDVSQRVSRMRRPEDQQRTVCAHLLTKMMLVKTFQKNLSDLHFKRDQMGKYQIGQGLHFNLSHSGDYVACAVGAHPVGIDIEEQVPRDFLLFQTLWSEEEKQDYPLHDAEIFYTLWTAKESYGKYKGFGLHPSLAQVTIRQDGSVHSPAPIGQARVIPFDMAPGYSAAVCVEDSVDTVTRYNWVEIESFYQKDGTYEKN